MIEGAARTARALEDRYGIKGEFIGEPAPAVVDDWTVSLAQAEKTLVGLQQAVTAAFEAGNTPVMVANTCSASLATLPVVAREHPDAVVLYIDAHGDFNTPETSSGYLGGMVLSAACGLWDSGHGAGLRPEQAVLVGTRDIDPAERELLDGAGVRVIPPAEATAENVMKAVGGSPVWVHIDWDVLDPQFLPADYVVPNGMSPAQIRAIFEAIPPGRLVGVEVAEFNAPVDEKSSAEGVATILGMLGPVFEASAGHR
ncbi:arginase family protein [Umezawaea endophytica]|uniref:Arginase family protein n=2 Tax=Umezawaea endophytica TaxID=1654476 RepID=A0A9X2VTB8_9PSEU|nr:arginase family protein [Umezawaea endophytica]